MKKSFYIVLFVIFLSSFTQTSRAQQPSSVAVLQNAEKDFATIYVYRINQYFVDLFFLFRNLPVDFGVRTNSKLERKKIATLKNKYYFKMRVPVGKYNFKTRLMRGSLDLDVQANGEYYLRMDDGIDCPDQTMNERIFQPTNCVSRDASIISIPIEQGSKEIIGLKPIKTKNIKDKKLVIVPSGT